MGHDDCLGGLLGFAFTGEPPAEGRVGFHQFSVESDLTGGLIEIRVQGPVFHCVGLVLWSGCGAFPGAGWILGYTSRVIVCFGVQEFHYAVKDSTVNQPGFCFVIVYPKQMLGQVRLFVYEIFQVCDYFFHCDFLMVSGRVAQCGYSVAMLHCDVNSIATLFRK